jgi:hypothetical protein
MRTIPVAVEVMTRPAKHGNKNIGNVYTQLIVTLLQHLAYQLLSRL